MAVGPRGPESAREELIALERQIFRHNQRRIASSVTGYDAYFKAYERRYRRRVAKYRTASTFDELKRRMAEANVVFVGDYHTLKQAQRTFLKLVRAVHEKQPVVLALEAIRGRFQVELDCYLDRELDEEDFLRLVQFREHWMFDNWENFRPIFEYAQEHRLTAYAIDLADQGERSLERRDEYAAKRVAEAVAEHPDAVVMVLVGELHIAPPHLPALVRGKCADRGVACKAYSVYQNPEELYWQLVHEGREHETEVVEVSKAEAAILNTPPVVMQQSYLNWLEGEEDLEDLGAPERNFKDIVEHLGKYLDIPVHDALEEVDVYTLADHDFLEDLRNTGQFTTAELAAIKRQILSSESYYIPRSRTVYLANLSLNHAAEEASHFVRHLCAGEEGELGMVDAFYARALNEALGFFGSKVINHKRKCAHERDFARMVRQADLAKKAGDAGPWTPREVKLARFVLLHKRFERGERPRGFGRIYEQEVELFRNITHSLGYILGDKLYYALVRGKITKAEVRDLFHEDFEEEGHALVLYFTLIERVGRTRTPKRV